MNGIVGRRVAGMERDQKVNIFGRIVFDRPFGERQTGKAWIPCNVIAQIDHILSVFDAGDIGLRAQIVREVIIEREGEIAPCQTPYRRPRSFLFRQRFQMGFEDFDIAVDLAKFVGCVFADIPLFIRDAERVEPRFARSSDRAGFLRSWLSSGATL